MVDEERVSQGQGKTVSIGCNDLVRQYGLHASGNYMPQS